MSAEDINMFCSHFDQQIHKVAQLQDGLYSRILWVTMLDSISIAAHPNLARKNHDRIITFIETYAQWGDQDRTSLPQMALQLNKSRLTNGKLYEHVTNEIAKWPHGRILGPDVDPQFKEIINLAYCDYERKIIKGCRYKELFYISRNYLVHEFRDPGYGSRGLSSSDSAFYHKYGSRWELVFPTALFRNFCSQGLTDLKAALEQDNRNPYDAYKFRSNW